MEDLIRISEHRLDRDQFHVVWTIKKFDLLVSHGMTFASEEEATKYEGRAYLALWEVLETMGFKRPA